MFLVCPREIMIFFWRIFKIPIFCYALGFRHEKILHAVTLYIAKKYEKFSLCYTCLANSETIDILPKQDALPGTYWLNMSL